MRLSAGSFSDATFLSRIPPKRMSYSIPYFFFQCAKRVFGICEVVFLFRSR